MIDSLFIAAKDFDKVVHAIREISGFKAAADGKNEMEIPSYAIQVGNHLRRVANVIAGLAIRESDEEKRKSKSY